MLCNFCNLCTGGVTQVTWTVVKLCSGPELKLCVGNTLDAKTESIFAELATTALVAPYDQQQPAHDAAHDVQVVCAACLCSSCLLPQE
jgi:hypothetical protein